MTRRHRAVGSTTAAVAIIVFLYLPLVVVMVFAFNSGGGLALPLEGVSLRWFAVLVADPAFSAAFGASFRVAAATAVISAVIGAAASYAFVRGRGRFLTVTELATRLPAMIPPLLLGVMLLTVIDLLDLAPSLITVTVGHVLYVIPYTVVIMVARLRAVDPEIELAARDLGAGPWEAVRRVILPVMWPAVVAVAAIAFAFSFDEVLITTFTSGLDPTLPLYVVSRLRRTIDPSINAVATILIVVPWLALGIAGLCFRVSTRRNATARAVGS